MELKAYARLAFALMLAAAAFRADAAEPTKRPTGVVELFTSQGCNSCPPADAFLSELVRRGDVVALAYHVDYWDYLGWRDTLAKPENTERQNDYRRAFDARSVYTPQAVINGRVHVSGADRDAIASKLREFEQAGEGMSVDISLSRVGDRLVIDVGEGSGTAEEANVVLVTFRPASPVLIERGDNRGQTITYSNAVKTVQTAGVWYGKPARFELPIKDVSKKGMGGCAVLLQRTAGDGLPGAILGAALLRKPYR